MSNIKINDVFQRIQYTATNAQTQFAIPFPFFSNAYVYVWQNGIQIIQGGGAGQYGITGAGSPSGGQITLVTPATTGDIITIEGIMPIDRTSIYSATISNLTGSDLNGDFNREVVMMKQIETTQALLQLQYAPWALVSQDQTVTKDRYIPLLLPNQVWAMNPGGTAIIGYDVPSSGGIAPDDATYILQVADAELPNAQAMGALASGLVVNTIATGVQLTRLLAATANELAITNANGIAGNPTYGFASNARFPGTQGIGLIFGTTAQRPVTPIGTNFRFNTDLLNLEYWDGTNWVQLSETDAVTIQGTEHQVLANGTFGTPLDGAVILTLPQDIDLTSTPTFAAVKTPLIIDTVTGLTVARFDGVASAVNNILFTNAIAGVGATISVVGSDTDIAMGFATKAAGVYSFSSTSSTPWYFRSGTAYQHVTTLTFPNTAASRNVTFQDSDGTLAYTSQLPTGAALTKVDDTNVTLSLGGSPLTALLNAASLTLGWTGQLSELRGGTAQSSYAVGDTLYSSATNTLSKLAGNITTAKLYLSQTGSGAASAAPVWAAIAGADITGAALTKTDDTNVTLTLGGTPTTALLRAASMTLGWTGILSKARGGTSVASATIAPTSLEFAAWDTNLNLSASAYIGGFLSQATASGTTTLTVASKQIQEFTGTLTQTVVMPVASTLVAGMYFDIINNSSGALTVNSSGSNLILTMAANTTARIVCVLNSGTTAASWNSTYVFDLGAGVVSITGTANQVIASASTGAVILSLPQSIGTTSDVTFGSLAFSPTTKGIVGTTTNNDAAAGYVGEYTTLAVTGSPVSLTNNTSTNLTQLTSLAAGDYDVWGNVSVNSASTTVLGATNVWLSTTSASLPADSSTIARQDWGSTGISRVGSSVSAGCYVIGRFTLSAPTTVYLSCFASFTTSTLNMVGYIAARRRR